MEKIAASVSLNLFWFWEKLLWDTIGAPHVEGLCYCMIVSALKSLKSCPSQ